MNEKKIFDENDTTIRSDILHLIIEHLINEKLFNAVNVLEDEINMKLNSLTIKRVKIMKFHKSILNGDWDLSVNLMISLVPKNRHRSFLYHILRQQYLELIDNGEHERAYSFLMKHLKPLEDISVSQNENQNEFKELCYLLTCKSVTEASGIPFKDWKHFYHQRELLSDNLTSELQNILKEECCYYDLSSLSCINSEINIFSNKKNNISSSRLTSLLQQSYAFQIQQSQLPVLATKLLNKELLPVQNSNIPEIISLESIKYQEKEPLNTLVSVNNQNSVKLQTYTPIIKRLTEDYHPTIFPTSVYAILSLSTNYFETSIPPLNFPSPSLLHRSTTPSSVIPVITPSISTSTSIPTTTTLPTPSISLLSPGNSMIGQYLIQQIESKITSIAMYSSIQNGITILGGLDTGEMVEWVSSPNQTSSSSKDVFDNIELSINSTSDNNNNNNNNNNKRLNLASFIQSIYSLPGLSSDDLKIYCETINPNTNNNNNNNNNISNNIDNNGNNFVNSKDNYLKKHKKTVINKKIRDIVTNYSSFSPSLCQDTQQYPLIAISASDGSVNLFKTKDKNNCLYDLQLRNKVSECCWYEHAGRINAHEGDAYTLAIDNSSTFLVSGGFDCAVSIMDLTTLSIIRRYQEHQASITHVGVNRVGNLIYSASRDGSVKFWDLLSGTCVKSFYPHYRGGGVTDLQINEQQHHHHHQSNHAEVTSATLSNDGNYLLTSSRFSPSRLIDIRKGQVVTKYTMKGHSGSSNWFYQSSFCANDEAVIAGTSLGTTALWSTQTGQLLNTLTLPTPSNNSNNNNNVNNNNSTFSSSLSSSSSKTQSYLSPSTSSFYSFMNSNDIIKDNKIIEQYKKSEIIRCYNDKFSGLVGSLTGTSYVLWK